MAINKVDYGDQTLMDLTEDTVTEDKVLEGETFHDRSGNLRTGSLVIPVQDVEVNGESVVNSEKVAEIDIPTTDIQTAVDEFETYNGGLLSECKVALSPNQDLHGYSEPWVGGAGKNKAPYTLANLITSNTSGTWNSNVYTINGVEFTVYTDDGGNVIAIKANGQNNGNQSLFILYFTLKDSNTYIVSGCPSGGASSTYEVYANLGNGSVYDKGSGATTTAVANYNGYISIAIRAGYNAQNLMFYPMLRLSTETDDTFEPYSNICPITGHTESKVGDDGKNKANISSNTVGSNQRATVEYDNNIIRLTATGTYARCGWLIPVEVGKTYTFSCKGITSAIGGTMVNYIYLGSADGVWSDSSPNYISRVQLTTELRDVNITFTATTNVCFIGAYITSTATSGVITLTDVQLELGSTATPYVPYNSYQVTVNLGGTYYSGTLDIVTGVLTATQKSIGASDFDTFVTNPSAGGLYYAQIDTSGSKANGNGICNMAKVDNQNAWIYTYPVAQIAPSQAGRIRFYCESTSMNEFLSQYANLQIVFELDTPLTIQLSPTMVKALVGENHLSAPLDGQEITESKYRELFTYDEVEEIAQQIADSKIDDVYTSDKTTFSSYTIQNRFARKVYDVPLLTPYYQKSSGATDITFNNMYIFNDSQTSCELIQIGSGPRVSISNVSISSGSVTFTFDAPLAADTKFVCSIINFY